MSLAVTLNNEFLTRHPADSARVIESVDLDRLSDELDGITTPALVAMLDYVAPIRAGDVFRRLNPTRQRDVLVEASPRLAVVVLAQLEADERAATLARLPDALRQDLRIQLNFPEDTAGRLMDGVFTACHHRMTVADAIDQLRDSRIRRARSLYVVDDDNRLHARVDVQDLALEDPATPLERIAKPVDAALGAMTPRAEIVAMLDQHRLDSLPVVDADQRLLGVVRYGSLFHAIEAEATADMQKMVGNADERALSSPLMAVRKRLPWLHVNLLTAALAASVVGLFEDVIAQFTALAVLLPVVAGQSGNAGAQALAVTMRGLALREIALRDWRKLLSKEIWIGLIDGAVLAVVVGVGVTLWSGSYGLGLVIAVAMVLSMLAAGIAGAVVPIVLIRAGQDPATASSIILTTVTDVAGFFSFLGTATALAFML